MRVFLTGAGGFVGSHVLIHLLHNTNWDLVLMDSFRHRGKTDRIVQQLDVSHPEYLSRVEVITHDLKVPFSEQMVNKLGKIDYVLSIASESHVDRSITDPRDFVENNVALILTLLEYAKDNPVKKFIQISTDEVYGPISEGGHKEGSPHRPSNPYSASKAAQEDICYSYWRTYGVPIIITNTMNIIGELQDTEKFVPMVIKRLLNDETVTIHASSKGEIGSRFYLHARNQADALMFLLKNHTPAMYPAKDLDRFNIVGNEEISNLDLAQRIALVVGRPLKYELVDFHSSRPGHDLRYGLDGSKIAGLGWKAPISFEESLERTVKWSIGHPEWLL